MKKKKGFSLIELMSSVAIFSIAMTGIFAAFATSSYIYKNDSMKLDARNHAQGIIQCFKDAGKNGLEDLINGGAYKTISVDGKDTLVMYLYFNDINSNVISDTEMVDTVKQILQDPSNIPAGVDVISSGNMNGSYDDSATGAKDGLSSRGSSLKKKYGSIIEISKYQPNNISDFNTYKINVQLWNLNKEYKDTAGKKLNKIGTNLTVYIGE